MSLPRLFGLRIKLGLNVLAVGGVILVSLGFIAWRSETDLARRESEARGLALLRALAIPCSIAMANNDMSLLDNYVGQFADAAHSLDLEYVAVLDFSGRVTAHTDAKEFGKVYDDDLTRRAAASSEPVRQVVERNGARVLEMAVPMVSGLRWGTVRAGLTLESAERAVRRGRMRLVWTGLAALGGSASLAYLLLSFMVLRPVMRMREMARSFGSGDLQARVRLHGSDEIGELAAGLDAMAQRIEDHTLGLEQLVTERTHELQEANAKLLEANHQLERLARTDSLTGLYNRRHVVDQLQFEIRRGSRSPHQFTLLMIDVDHFKHYNDAHGHSAGDEMLMCLAALFQQSLRATDVIARYGGEEFVVLLLDTGPDEGVATARKLQQIVAASPRPRAETQPMGKLTISIGVAFYPQDAEDARTLIDAADEALYRSKQLGRNRVTVWREPASAAS